MFVASHVAAGSLIYDALRDEPLPVRLALGLSGCFVSHWLLDVVPVIHDLAKLSPAAQAGIVLYNLAAVAGLWLATRREKRWWLPSERVLWGLASWLIWDVFWLFDSGGGPHRLTEMFNGVCRWTDPRSLMLEPLFIFLVILISLPAIRRAQYERKFNRRLARWI